MVMEIQYPVAYARPRETVREAAHINAARRERPHCCFGCHREMVIRRGPVRRRHFAHKAAFGQCEGDNALHEAAKAFICQGLRRAVATEGEYRVRYPLQKMQDSHQSQCCQRRRKHQQRENCGRGDTLRLVIFQPDGSPRVIIEIVVTHDLETKTEQKYKAANYPVVTVKPSWDTLLDLCQSAIGSRILNVKGDTRYCSNCRAERKVVQKQAIKAPTLALKTPRQRRRWISPKLPPYP